MKIVNTKTFAVNTVGGFYEININDLEVLKDLGSTDNLVSIHYDNPSFDPNGSKTLKAYGFDIPIDISIIVANLDNKQSDLLVGFFSKLAGKYCFAGTKIYLTHKKQLPLIYKAIQTIAEDIDKAFDLFAETSWENTYFLPYRHICEDILEQIKH